jgi:hypothetical protein
MVDRAAGEAFCRPVGKSDLDGAGIGRVQHLGAERIDPGGPSPLDAAARDQPLLCDIDHVDLAAFGSIVLVPRGFHVLGELVNPIDLADRS